MLTGILFGLVSCGLIGILVEIVKRTTCLIGVNVKWNI